MVRCKRRRTKVPTGRGTSFSDQDSEPPIHLGCPHQQQHDHPRVRVDHDDCIVLDKINCQVGNLFPAHETTIPKATNLFHQFGAERGEIFCGFGGCTSDKASEKVTACRDTDAGVGVPSEGARCTVHFINKLGHGAGCSKSY